MALPLLTDALRAFEEGRLADAETLCRGAVSRAETEPAALALMVAILTRAGRSREAVEWQERVVALGPRSAAEVRRLAGLQESVGDAAAALALWEEAVALEPTNPRGLNNLGKILTDLGDAARGVECLRRALQVQPNYPLALNNLGRALGRLGRWAEAVPVLEQAILQKADFPEAHYNLASALQSLGRIEAALASHTAADRYAVPAAAARLQRGALLLAARRAAEALSVFDALIAAGEARLEAEAGRIHALLRLGETTRACERTPASLGGEDHAALLAAHAAALLADGRERAVVAAVATRAAAADPALAAPHVVLGSLYRRDADLTAALAAYEEALRRDPAEPAALFGKALALATIGTVPEALAAFEQVVNTDPTHTEACLAAAAYCRRVKRDSAALKIIDLLLEHDPGHPEALRERATLLIVLRRAEEALPAFERALEAAPHSEELQHNLLYARLALCDWQDYERSSEAHRRKALDGRLAGAPHALLYHCDDPRAQLLAARAEAATHAGRAPAHVRPISRDKAPLRIAYVSPDFRGHPVGELMSHVLASHDPCRVTVVGYALGPPDHGPVRQRIEAACAEFRSCELMRDDELAARLRDDRIDIAVDLAGHTAGNRLATFVQRVAPVQVSFLGYPSTVGTTAMDYIIADRVALPDPADFDEQPAYLPGTLFPAARESPGAAPMDRLEAGLPADGIVYAAFHTPQKMNPTFFALWCEVLSAVPDAYLWLRDGPPALRDNLRAFARGRGVDPNRLLFATRVDSVGEYRRRLALADLLLDTAPYNAHTTTADALGAGVPVVTVPGRTLASRIAASLLSAAGLADLACASLDDYRALAISIGCSSAAREALRARVSTAVASSTLFDTRRFTANLETAFEMMAERARAGLPAAPIDVPPHGQGGTRHA